MRSASECTATLSIPYYILGEVAAPGPKLVAPGTTFLQALSQSGGLTNFAAVKRFQRLMLGYATDIELALSPLAPLHYPAKPQASHPLRPHCLPQTKSRRAMQSTP